MSSVPITIREADTGDVFELVRLRRRMYEDMRYSDAAALEAMSALTAAYLRGAPSRMGPFVPGSPAMKAA